MRIIDRNGMRQKTLWNTSDFSSVPMPLQCSPMPASIPHRGQCACRVSRVHPKFQHNTPSPVAVVAADPLPTVIVGLFFNCWLSVWTKCFCLCSVFPTSQITALMLLFSFQIENVLFEEHDWIPRFHPCVGLHFIYFF